MKHISLKTKIFFIFIVLLALVITSVVIGVIVANWMGQQNNLMVTFTSELDGCLNTKEKVAFLRGQFIQAFLTQDPEKLKEIEMKNQKLAQEIKEDINRIFNRSTGCLQCHSQGEMKELGKETESNLNEFLRIGQEILHLKRAKSSKIDDLVRHDLLSVYQDLQSFLGHGVEESEKFVHQAKQKVKSTYMLVKKLLSALAVLSLFVAIGGIFVSNYKIIGPVRQTARQFKQIATNVLSIAENQSQNTSKQASAVVEVSASAEELSRSAEALTKQAEVIVQVAHKSMKEAMEVTERMQSTVNFINTVKSHSDEATEKIMRLGETIDEIGKVLTLIEEVASQTKLLAFNASIEAVSAGEAGKRFSIVAKHIKDLADNTSASTEEIRKLIEEIKSLAHTTILSTEQMQKAVNKGVSQVSMAGEIIEKIKEVIQENNEVAQKINIATTQQKTATEQITAAMEELSHAAQELAEGSKQTVEAMQRLNENASLLQKMIEG